MRLQSLVAYGLAAAMAAAPAAAQFTSGSNGSDGALNIPANAGTVIFDPVALGLDTDGDNVFHFTTITIGATTRLKLKASKLRNKAVVWLAQGNVVVESGAVVDLIGEDGIPITSPVQVGRRPAEPGPGGFPGGLGSRTDTAVFTPASDGVGPAGARGVAPSSGCTANASQNALSGHMNIAMVPLVGGAGGAGIYCANAGSTGNNGAAGGGAIRIVSTTQITVTGFIYAHSGAPVGSTGSHGFGGGGMIHLIAPTITGASNALNAQSTYAAAVFGDLTTLSRGNGVIRLNANTVTGLSGSIPTNIAGSLFTLPLPVGQPEVKITQVSGVNVVDAPSGQIAGADVVINTAAAASVNIAAKNIPVGTVLNLRISSEVVKDQAVVCGALAGTLANSTATCTATFPLGANITIATASW